MSRCWYLGGDETGSETAAPYSERQSRYIYVLFGRRMGANRRSSGSFAASVVHTRDSNFSAPRRPSACPPSYNYSDYSSSSRWRRRPVLALGGRGAGNLLLGPTGGCLSDRCLCFSFHTLHSVFSGAFQDIKCSSVYKVQQIGMPCFLWVVTASFVIVVTLIHNNLPLPYTQGWPLLQFNFLLVRLRRNRFRRQLWPTQLTQTHKIIVATL